MSRQQRGRSPGASAARHRVIDLNLTAFLTSRAATARSIPLGRYQETSEVASWILFLASQEAGFVTGQTISVNGGRYMAQ
jgi:NAD(P)-dependent dehydrogenase (short-subunit alcohol dehydrogenase family)